MLFYCNLHFHSISKHDEEKTNTRHSRVFCLQSWSDWRSRPCPEKCRFCDCHKVRAFIHPSNSHIALRSETNSTEYVRKTLEISQGELIHRLDGLKQVTSCTIIYHTYFTYTKKNDLNTLHDILLQELQTQRTLYSRLSEQFLGSKVSHVDTLNQITSHVIAFEQFTSIFLRLTTRNWKKNSERAWRSVRSSLCTGSNSISLLILHLCTTRLMAHDGQLELWRRKAKAAARSAAWARTGVRTATPRSRERD